MTKVPTRSPTHEDIEPRRLASMGLELEDIAADGEVTLDAVVELAEERGRPVGHYLAAIPLATELRLAGAGKLAVRVCAGTCQRWGALDLLDHLAERCGREAAALGSMTRGRPMTIVPVTCLDRCDQAPACEIHGDHGQLVVAPATVAALDEALDHLA